MVVSKVKMDLIGQSYDQITVGDLLLGPYWGLIGLLLGSFGVIWGWFGDGLG